MNAKMKTTEVENALTQMLVHRRQKPTQGIYLLTDLNVRDTGILDVQPDGLSEVE